MMRHRSSRGGAAAQARAAAITSDKRLISRCGRMLSPVRAGVCQASSLTVLSPPPPPQPPPNPSPDREGGVAGRPQSPPDPKGTPVGARIALLPAPLRLLDRWLRCGRWRLYGRWRRYGRLYRDDFQQLDFER